MKKILVSGLWYTGSSAVCDILHELDDIWLMPDNQRKGLPEFLGYHLGGFDDFYRVIENSTLQRKKIMLNNLASTLSNSLFSNLSYVSESNKRRFSEITREYVSALLQLMALSLDVHKKGFIELTEQYFDEISHVAEGVDWVLFDQAISPSSNIFFWKKVFKDSKLIVVERNSLDQISDILEFSHQFWTIRTGGRIEEFLKEQEKDKKRFRHKKELYPNDVEIFKFEDLVRDYNKTRSRLLEFLGFDAQTLPPTFKYFNPAESSKNINKNINVLTVEEIEEIRGIVEAQKINYVDF